MTQDWLNAGRTKLLIWTCGGLIAAAWSLVLVWLISGDLEWETAVATVVLTLILVGIGLLARNGRSRAATWILVGLLMVLIALDSSSFGLSSPGAAAFVLPVVLAACGLGLWPGLGVALAATAVVWLTAWATTAGWYEPYGLVEISHLTFNAPFYSVVFLVTAVIVGGWTRYLTTIVNRFSD
ncbi:MAG: hypothetical protein IAF02_16965 [Anaerolineae bacterium]|nr:hypothetical protein [Anaerolineae bacterium]